MEQLNAFSLSGVLIAVSCAVMAISMFIFARNRLNIIWGVFCLLVFMWGAGAYLIGGASEAGRALFYWRLAYLGVIFIPPVFAHFVHALVGRRLNQIIWFAYAIAGIYALLNAQLPLLFIRSVMPMFGIHYLDATTSPIYSSFVGFFFVLTIYSLRVLWVEYRKAEGRRRKQILYFFLGSAIGFTGGSFSFLPEYGIPVYPYPNMLVSLFPIVMGYAAVRYKLFSMRVVFSQILVFIIWAFVGVRFLLSLGTPQALNDAGLLVIVVILGILMVQSIVREVNQRERLEDLNRIKSEYLSFASHQVKAPMTAVKGYATLIYDGSYGVTPEKVREAAAKIREAANRMIMTVNNILNIRKIEEEKMEYVRAPRDIVALVRDVADELQPLADSKKLSLTLESEHPQIMSDIDEQYVRHVFQNVIENAIKYTDSGFVRIHLSQPDDTVLCSVSDSGRGIAPDALSRLFEEFHRITDRAHASDGTGLGLYIARKIIEGHGGRVWAASPGIGKGATFFISLPRIAGMSDGATASVVG